MPPMTVDRGEIRRRLQDFHRIDRIGCRSGGLTVQRTPRRVSRSHSGRICSVVSVSTRRVATCSNVTPSVRRPAVANISTSFKVACSSAKPRVSGKTSIGRHRQALDYLAGGSIGRHEFPKYVIATDLARLRIDRLGEGSWSVEFEVGHTTDHLDQLLFLADGYVSAPNANTRTPV